MSSVWFPFIFNPLSLLIQHHFYNNSAQAEFGGFGLRRLAGQGFLGAKAVHSDQHFGYPMSFRPSRQASGGILFLLL